MRRLTLATALTLAVVVALAAGTLIGTAFAAPDTRETPWEAGAEGLPVLAGEYCETFLESFAEQLDVDRAALIPAAKEAAKAAIDAAVEAGDLTPERADALKGRIDAIDEDECPVGGFGGRLRHGFRGALREVADAAAAALGLDRGALVQRLAAGSPLEEIATEQEVEYAAVKTAVIDALRAELDGAVADQRVTQEVADEVLVEVTEWLDAGGDPARLFPGRGRGFGFRGLGGFMGLGRSRGEMEFRLRLPFGSDEERRDREDQG